MNRILLLVLCLHPILIKSQESEITSEKDSLIKVRIIQNGRFHNVVYTLNNEVLTNSRLKSLLSTNLKSAEEFDKFQRQRRTALIILPFNIASIVLGGVEANNKKNAKGSIFSKGAVPFSISFGLSMVETILSVKNNHFKKAVEEYNRQH